MFKHSLKLIRTRNSFLIPATRFQIRNKYSDKVLEHYNNPRNIGSLNKDSPNVGTAIVGAPSCGDVMKFQIEVDPETGIVTESKFRTFGCGSAIASSSLATEWVKGKTLQECLEITNNDIASHLALPPVKLHCSLLAEQAIRAAIKDFEKKNSKNNNNNKDNDQTQESSS